MKKNLLILVPSLQLGGQERVAVRTAEIMADFWNVFLVIFDSRNAAYASSCQVFDINIPAASNKIAKVINSLHRSYVLRKLKNNLKIDCALSFGTSANLANVLSGHRGKTIISVRGFNSISNGILSRFVYVHSDIIVCCSLAICVMLARFNRAYGEKIKCLYNPYDMEGLQTQAKETVTDYIFSPNTIVSHGRLDEVKNYPRLIKAFSLVRDKVPDAQLLLIGEGHLRPQLETLLKSLNLENSVTLLGFRKNPFAYLAKSALYVLSSYSEGFPNSLVEGMIFLPSIAVDCKTGPREILSDGGSLGRVCKYYEEADYGILVQPAVYRKSCEQLTNDDRILADAILAVLNDPAKMKELQEKAKSRVKAFSYEVYRDNLMTILES